jgi:hypothetical protein
MFLWGRRLTSAYQPVLLRHRAYVMAAIQTPVNTAFLRLGSRWIVLLAEQGKLDKAIQTYISASKIDSRAAPESGMSCGAYDTRRGVTLWRRLGVKGHADSQLWESTWPSFSHATFRRLDKPGSVWRDIRKACTPSPSPTLSGSARFLMSHCVGGRSNR